MIMYGKFARNPDSDPLEIVLHFQMKMTTTEMGMGDAVASGNGPQRGDSTYATHCLSLYWSRFIGSHLL